MSWHFPRVAEEIHAQPESEESVSLPSNRAPLEFKWSSEFIIRNFPVEIDYRHKIPVRVDSDSVEIRNKRLLDISHKLTA
jgi:hypothetical protein